MNRLANEQYRPLLKRGVAEIIVEEEMRRLLGSGRKLRLKQGFDPSHPDIHLGHVVGLRKLRQFQELGHQVILIVGDWTAQIGDPSGESVTRPMLSPEEVRANAETYMKQFFKVVDRERTRVVWQSEWFGKFNLGDVIRLTSKFTVAQMLQRDDFSKRHTSGRPITITEFLYPLLQAYDSVVIEADVEFGGTDQKFNCLVGRELQQMMGQPPQQVFLVPLLVGTDGSQKMSKSLGNYIAVDEPPNEMFGKVMSIPDNLMMNYFELLTDVSDEELEEFRKEMASDSVNPMIWKKRLAYDITKQFHGPKAAQEAQDEFEGVFQRREVPEHVPRVVYLRGSSGGSSTLDASLTVGHEVDITEFLANAKVIKSRSEAKRLLAQGAIEVDGKKVTANTVRIWDGSIIKVGKRRFVKIVNAG
ncbi:MAG: tyrosine--tRNA ligase [Dehalococcoidia bacterium]|nr:tyrosine--tRNA ligase [Dehalococcoidia bacterium]